MIKDIIKMTEKEKEESLFEEFNSWTSDTNNWEEEE